MSRVLLALLCSALLCSALLCSAVSIWHQIQSLSTPDFQKASGFFDEKSRGMYSNHPGEKQWQNLAVSNRLTRLASVALRRRLAPVLPVTHLDMFSILRFPKIARERQQIL